MEQNLNPIISISEKKRTRTVNTLLKVKLQAMIIQLAALLNRNFRHERFSENFLSNCSSKFLIITGSKRLESKVSVSKIRKTSKVQKKIFA